MSARTLTEDEIKHQQQRSKIAELRSVAETMPLTLDGHQRRRAMLARADNTYVYQGEVPLAQAQTEIVDDWVAAAKRRLGR